ncbi:hypothetical protein KUCAC02_023499 [Chaenocephalus aceratus]|uniref:Uncharacterized protein n=1 Tax=Chaenocephalus aceratus TaxID=36190 RepID=A0ACB9XQ69_CHAAC|nr:hypothetical protein KUCAC02_023499 [Chaenocephalus aceratus]
MIFACFRISQWRYSASGIHTESSVAYCAKKTHGILYPARLIVTINEETFIFKEPKEAEKVLKEKRPDLFGM